MLELRRQCNGEFELISKIQLDPPSLLYNGHQVFLGG